MSRLLTFSTLVLLFASAGVLDAADPTEPTVLGQPILLAPAVEPMPTTIHQRSEKEVPDAPEAQELILPSSESYFPPDEPLLLPEVPAVPSPLLPPGEPVVLYPHVIVKHPHEAHPLGVPTVIAVPDPRDRSCLVNVEVCLPPCECKKVRHFLRGTIVKYDYGEYVIRIISRHGVVIISYDA